MDVSLFKSIGLHHLLAIVNFGFSCLTPGGLTNPRAVGPCSAKTTTAPITQLWGQYSPYFPVEDGVRSVVPEFCNITFVNVLSRHGARDPTASKGQSYKRLIQELQMNVTYFYGKYAFIDAYNYTLGFDQLTKFGTQQMFESGLEFYERYSRLSNNTTPFVRASGQKRVVESPENWVRGFAKNQDSKLDVPILVISEEIGSNNSLNHGLCDNFEDGPISKIGKNAQASFATVAFASTKHRLNKHLRGAMFSISSVINLMDMCPYETVASVYGNTRSPFCDLFTVDEWRAYNYYQTLGKFYGHGNGNPLGPTNGVGFANELFARMTQSLVDDNTSTNQTLDNNPITFPLDRTLYADFSHDNDMTEVLSALGLYNDTATLSNETIINAGSDQAAGYSAAWTVPFAARIYFEKMRCEGQPEELVRVIVNNRVVPLIGCGADEQGRCTLSAFVKSQVFARGGGSWNECFDDIGAIEKA